MRLFPVIRSLYARLMGRSGRSRKHRQRQSFRPRLDFLEDRLAPAITTLASATSNLLNVPVQFSLESNGTLLKGQGAAAVSVANGVQGLYQGVDGTGTKVVYDLSSNVLREYTPNHGWVPIGSADQVVQDNLDDVIFRQQSSLLLATGVPASTSAGHTMIASGGVQALAQFSPSQTLYLQNKTLYVLPSANLSPAVVQYSVLGLAQDGPNQVLFLDGGGTLNLAATGSSSVTIVASNVQALAQDGFNQAVYLSAGTLMSTAAGSTPVTLATNVQALAETHNRVAYVIHNGGVAELTAANKLAPVSGPADMTQLIVDGREQLYALNATGTLERVTGLTAQTIAWGVTNHAIDTAGELVVLEGPTVYQYFTGPYTIGGINTGVQFALDGSGNRYSISKNGTLASAATSSSSLQQIATGVTQVAVDSAGELVYLQGPYTWNYVSGGLGTSGTSVSANGPPPERFALDLNGNLYELAGGVLTVAATSTDTPQQLATGVLGMAADVGGQVVAIEGIHSYAYFGGMVGSGGSSPTAQYAVDPAGDLYTYYPSNDSLYSAATATSTPHLVATGVTRMAMDAADEVVLLKGPSMYEYLLGGLGTGGSSVGTTYALDSHGDLYTLHANTVTLAVASSYAPKTIATGVAHMFMDNTGQVALLFGNGQLSYYDPVGQQLVPVLSSQAQALVDAHGQLYSRGSNGVVYEITARGVLTIDYLAQSIDLNAAGSTTTYTPIGRLWHSLGGSKSTLGLPTGSEQPIVGGTSAEFANGEITYTSQTGPHVIPALFSTDYDELNGPAGFLGLPIGPPLPMHNITGTPVGQMMFFQGGALFVANTGAIVAANSQIAQTYWNYQLNGKGLGAPVSRQASEGSPVEFVTFTDGAIYYSPATGARVLADPSTLAQLGTGVAFSLTGGSAGNFTKGWDDILNTNLGVQFSATGTLSLNLAQQTAWANVDFAGTQFDSDKLEALLDGQLALPSIDPLEVLTSLGRSGVSSGYAAWQQSVYNSTNANNIYVSSERFVDWASPSTLARLAGQTILGAGDATLTELEENVGAEFQGLIAWATRRFGSEEMAIAQLGLAFAQGRVHISGPIPITYYYEAFGVKVPEVHYGFTITVSGLPASTLPDPLAPQADMIGTATLPAPVTAGVSSDDLQNSLGQLAIVVCNQVLGTRLDPSAFDLGTSIAANLVNQSLYSKLFNILGVSESVFAQAYQGNPVIDLTNSSLANNLANTVNGELASLSSIVPFSKYLHFQVNKLTFNTSTYELNAQISLTFAYSWGTVSNILWGPNGVGSYLGKVAGTAAGHFTDWLNAETGKLATWWQNVGGPALPQWATDAANNLPNTLQELGAAPQTFASSVAQAGSQVLQSPVGQTLGKIVGKKISLSLVDSEPFGFVPENM